MIGGATSTAVMARHDSREATAAASQGETVSPSPRLQLVTEEIHTR